MGVLSELQEEMQSRMPALWQSGSKGVVGMCPKAYRWVREMEEIAAAHREEGAFADTHGGKGGIFDGVAEVYRVVAEDTVLGKEKQGNRKRGLDVQDVAKCVGEGLEGKRKKVE